MGIPVALMRPKASPVYVFIADVIPPRVVIMETYN